MTQATPRDHDTHEEARPAGFDDIYGTRVACALRRAAKAEAMLVASLLTEAGVYPGQENLLQLLWQRGPQSQAQLAEALDLDPSTVTKTLQRLERNGLISRCPSETDKRANVVGTTTSGDALRDKVEHAIAEADRVATAGLSDAEVRELARLLNKVTENLCAGRDR
ncbi:MarR family winged helix-turn-helix transcriptional regulator [Allorhizocola rhizosphaerae]|uniref:MarR family winged helix-turn-helix transcriptional regulator n=1 Tax=Allorhizocola rhizosphaerae TaxID=1872709 RepID=UPI000E3E2EFC|nr:MarR family winged helix-turn-helix transcriptional regulator [Allorhizocola rhizosphaerae]